MEKAELSPMLKTGFGAKRIFNHQKIVVKFVVFNILPCSVVKRNFVNEIRGPLKPHGSKTD